MLSGKVALVTGAAQGIGYAIASALMSNGAKVSVVEVNEDAGRAACMELEKTYGPNKVLFVQCDVTDKDKLRTSFQQTVAVFGKVDIVCNNAGVCNEANWRKNIEIDLIALIEGTNLGIELMSPKSGGNGGHIVNIASITGLIPFGIAPTYCAAKAGVIHFTRCLKDLSVSDGIFVNCICPDVVDTPMVQGLKGPIADVAIARGLLSPSDVAEGVLQILRDSPSGAAMKVVLNESRSYITFPPELCAPELPK